MERKSTDDGENQQLTLDAQRFEIRRYANANGLRIVHHFVEKRSAKRPGRPVFREMINRLKKGEATGIIAWHPDRLSRNALDSGELLYLLSDGTIKDFKFPQHWFENTPQGKFSLYQAFALAQLEIDTLSKRVTAAYDEKARRGQIPNKPPIGYTTDRKARATIIDKKWGYYIPRIFKMCASGKYSVSQIRAELTRAGFRRRRGVPFQLSTYHHILNHRAYYGLFQRSGEWRRGEYPPLISKRLFDAAQKQLKRQERKWSPNFKRFLYRGALSCGECGASITFEIQKRKGYLRCTKKRGPCKQPYLRLNRMNPELGKVIREIALPKEVLDELTTSLEKLKANVTARMKRQKASLKKALDELNARQERTVDLMLKGVLSEKEFNSVKRKLVEDIASAEEKLKEFEAQSDNPLEPLETVLKRLSEATVLANSKNETKKLEFLKNLGSNLKIENRVVQATWEKPFSLAAKWKKRFVSAGEKPVRKDTNMLLVPLIKYCSNRG